MSIKIRGKEYITVAERVQEVHGYCEDKIAISITSEVLSHTPVVVKSTVTIGENTFTGISAANPAKAIEKQSPYEVAETSAVGRALGFAGFGIVEGIASADEMAKVAYGGLQGSTGARISPEEAGGIEEADIEAGFNRFNRG